jgi:hypothetical protein
MVMSIKKSNIQASAIYPNAILCHNEIHTFFQLVSSGLIGITYLLWKLMTKGEMLEQRYDHGISWTTKDLFQGGEIKLKMDMDKGATLK